MNNEDFAQLSSLISDPFSGPWEGEDFWIDMDTKTIQVQDNNIKLAATIMRKTNNSELFTAKLIKIGTQGDSILLGFDMPTGEPPIYNTYIGAEKDTKAYIKLDGFGKHCIYINDKRIARMFVKLSSAKSYLRKLNKELQHATVPNPNDSENYD